MSGCHLAPPNIFPIHIRWFLHCTESEYVEGNRVETTRKLGIFRFNQMELLKKEMVI